MARAASSPDAPRHIVLSSHLETDVFAHLFQRSAEQDDEEFLQARLESDSDGDVVLRLVDSATPAQSFRMSILMARRLPQLFAELVRRAETAGLFNSVAEISATMEEQTLREAP